MSDSDNIFTFVPVSSASHQHERYHHHQHQYTTVLLWCGYTTRFCCRGWKSKYTRCIYSRKDGKYTNVYKRSCEPHKWMPFFPMWYQSSRFHCHRWLAQMFAMLSRCLAMIAMITMLAIHRQCWVYSHHVVRAEMLTWWPVFFPVITFVFVCSTCKFDASNQGVFTSAWVVCWSLSWVSKLIRFEAFNPNAVDPIAIAHTHTMGQS